MTEALKESSCTIDHINTYQHVNQIPGYAEPFEYKAPFPNLVGGRQTEFNCAFLHCLTVQMDHPDRPMAYADRTDKI